MRKRNDTYIAYYKCTRCGNDLTIPRQKGRIRGEGHIKDIWCQYCKEKQKFVEIEPY